MGGTSNINSSKKKSHQRVAHNNELMMHVIVELAREHVDDLPFSARAVAIRAGKSDTSPIITRDRGGLKQFICDQREAFLSSLSLLVNEEMKNAGEISSSFCRRVGFLIIPYSALFELDIILGGHRSVQKLVNAMRPLIREPQVLMFGAELYVFLQDWYENGFSQESVMARYDKKLRQLLTKYQITRPDIGIRSTASRTSQSPSKGGSFFMANEEA